MSSITVLNILVGLVLSVKRGYKSILYIRLGANYCVGLFMVVILRGSALWGVRTVILLSTSQRCYR